MTKKPLHLYSRWSHLGKAHALLIPTNSVLNLLVLDRKSEHGLEKNSYGTGVDHAITSGIEGAWTPNPTKWDHDYLKCYWVTSGADKSPAGASQQSPKF
jgi:catalase (peroxidase I)